MTDGRCADCRGGHYFTTADGVPTNFPCTKESCSCWFCGPIVTTVQAAAWKSYHAQQAELTQ